MPSNKVDIVLSNPWRDPNGKVHDVGERLSVEASVAERLVAGGAAAPATKTDAATTGGKPASAK
jgi:hypothetical protein